MRNAAAGLLWLLAALPATAAQRLPSPVTLDSGAVVRLHWPGGTQKARLLARWGPESAAVRYCIYPSTVCGASTVNPPVTRPTTELTGVDVRRGTAAGRGALMGAAAGAAGGLLVVLGQGLSDRPALSTGEQVAEVGLSAVLWGGIGGLIGAASDNWQALPRQEEP